MVANPEPKPLTLKQRRVLGLYQKIANIRATMHPLHNRREQKSIRKLQREIKEIEQS